MIVNQDQRIRLDGVTLPLTQNDLCESAYDAGTIGFIAKFLVQTTLPHRRQTGSHYTRTDGRFTLRITDVGGAGLPFGSYPRLILIWMTSEAVRTASRELELGASLSRFMAELGLQATGGNWGTIPRFRDQMQRLVGAAVAIADGAHQQAVAAGFRQFPQFDGHAFGGLAAMYIEHVGR